MVRTSLAVEVFGECLYNYNYFDLNKAWDTLMCQKKVQNLTETTGSHCLHTPLSLSFTTGLS